MTFFHFVNCIALAYAPFFIAYKYSGLSEYSSVWRCAQAALVYFLTQLGKMLVLATFFPASDGEGFDLVPELMKSSADIFDVIGLHVVITYLMAGKSEVRFLAAGLGWAFAHSVASRMVGFWVGARATAFHWKFIQMALESNIDLVFYIAMPALVWLFSRNDLHAGMKRVVIVLLTFCVFHVFVYQAGVVYLGLRSWLLLSVKAALTAGLAAATLVSYSSLGIHSNQYRS
ncbi:Transmembrane protein [Toxocara canis]|uniref:BOS complex subunit TMEM147 n=1 Tax=Toxocara canis TaxID=6265 RepID=A0A0B2W2M7_TOXCA|nr:Transmembrane protein [Toxocara canis]